MAPLSKVFGINANRQTPAFAQTDGVDFVPMSKGKVYLIQLLNIAGVGPIFWTHLRCTLWSCGHVVGLWLAVSLRVPCMTTSLACCQYATAANPVPNLAGKCWKECKHFMTYFAIVPVIAGWCRSLSLRLPRFYWASLQFGTSYFVKIIFCVYCYLIAAVVPVDKNYRSSVPFFGALLFFMSFGLAFAIILSSEHTLLPNVQIDDFFKT